jgi:hypothetical protein
METTRFDVNYKKIITTNHDIIKPDAVIYTFNNELVSDAGSLYLRLEKEIGCTYLIYMYENLNTNEKYVYSSNWGWQNHLIQNKLINNCPIFLAAFDYLDKRDVGEIYLPWCHALPSNRREREVCGIRSEFNIGNGFGYGGKGHGIRESLAFGGDMKDKSFYKHFLADPGLFQKTLHDIRHAILTRNYLDKILSNTNDLVI